MMQDKDLERAIQQVTQQRKDDAPSFDTLIEKPRRSGPSPARWWAAAAAAIVIPVALFMTLRNDEPGHENELDAFDTIIAWQAPTDVFLPSAMDGWDTGVPPLGSPELTIYDGT
ncbi:MAG: hypothetical protein OEV00_07830, partial [Acidobacteriota bacterium]|nr:hypothetical protein [Acidobacteriota bacterium]